MRVKTHQSPDATPELHVEPVDDDRWTWRFVEGDLELQSNEIYSTREDAAERARRAYPDVELSD
jgi:hypothetical protein